MTIVYDYGSSLYINLTNRCPCDCSFCIRRHGSGVNAEQSLWLDHEPSLEEIEAAIRPIDFSRYDEIIFCGYGEPCERFDALIHTARLIRKKTDLPIRVNTNGLSDLINDKKTAPLLAKCIDRISISLNAPDEETYFALCKPSFGKKSFHEVIKFALECKEHISDVCCTVVGHSLDETQLRQCSTRCKTLGLRLRIRW